MKWTRLPMLILVVTLMACGSGNNPQTGVFTSPATAKNTPGEIKGVWSRSVDIGSGHTAEMHLRIEDDQVIVAQRCAIDGKKLLVNVAVSSKIVSEAKVIRILESREDKKSESVDCVVSLTQGDIPYSIKDNALTLAMDPAEPTKSVTFGKLYDL